MAKYFTFKAILNTFFSNFGKVSQKNLGYFYFMRWPNLNRLSNFQVLENTHKKLFKMGYKLNKWIQNMYEHLNI